jgi:predicted ATPase/DNA-binding XRE family transcriptional regulator
LWRNTLAEISFGEWLKRRRGAEGWTQQQLAQKISCSTSALRKMESEERRPSAQIVEKLAVVFAIPQNERKTFLRFARGDWHAFSDSSVVEAPWHVSNSEPQSNLPSSITSFIGREKEQGEVIDLLRKNRLVTLAGAGGIGKTRLAIQVGHQLLSTYPDGVWFIPLDSLSDPTRVPQTVAATFDIREGPSQPIIETLKNVFRQKTLLLIIDNCEHLLSACAQLIKTLLTYCPNLRVLTTSRELLKVEGEAIYYLPPLSTPERSSDLENLAEYASIRLFVERARLAQSTFQLTKDNAQTILDICRRVDGIPLAIELTAARVNILKVEEILKQLQNSFALLASDDGTRLPRHQTLQASMNWSWGLLSEAERMFLEQLSVFAGGWTLEAAQAVCDGDVLSLTDALVKKSLIVVDQQPGHETRYRFHEIVRQYAYQKLVESDE